MEFFIIFYRFVMIVYYYHNSGRYPSSYLLFKTRQERILTTILHRLVDNVQMCNSYNRSTTDQIFCIRQTLEKKWEYNETVHEGGGSVRREGLNTILIELGGTHETRLIKMCLNKEVTVACNDMILYRVS
jgi:hypothetical protein